MITRYDPKEYPTSFGQGTHDAMEEIPQGDYVLFVDYASMLASLCREFDNLKEKYDRLVGKIGEIYQEA